MQFSRQFLIVSIFILGLASLNLFGQAKFSEDRSRFSADLKQVMDASQNPQAIKIGQTFDGVWNSGNLSEKQKQQIYSILISMQKKRYRVNPNYMGYFELYNNAVLLKGVKNAKLDSLIYVTSQVLENNPVVQYQKYLDFLNVFLGQNRLYSTTFNKLNVQTTNFNIWYIDPKTATTQDAPSAEPAVSKVEKLNDASTDWATSFSEDTKPKGSTDVNMAEVLGSNETPTITLPPLTGPYIKINNAILTIVTKADSVSIKNVRGNAMAFNNIFIGDKGTFDWTYAGMNGNDVFAELDKYTLNVSKPELYAENVTFSYKGKIEKPIKGSFAFKALNKVDKTGNPYPSFASYSNKINLGNIGEGLSLTGGFSLNGKIINTSSADLGNSTLTLTKANILKFKAVSKGFEITDSAVTSKQAAIILPFSGDSIYHFGVKLTFLKKKNQLKLTQSGGNFKNASFYDTYHKLEIQSEAALYDINKDKIDFYIINARNQVPVRLSSYEYFEEEKFDKLKGLYPFHPLQMATGFAKSGKGNSFYADDLASANKLNAATVRSAMSVLAQEGFAEFNSQTGFVKLTKKAWHYSLSKSSKKDFDGIQLECLSPQKTNVILDLVSKKMTANGVKRAFLCKPLNVYFETDSNNQVIIEKNRKITFDGMVSAGRFQFSGRNYKFDYDSFMVRMGRVDVVNINISKDYNIGIYGGENMKHKRLGIELEQSRGELYINKPNNKSGKRLMPEYPIFHASTGGVVYFDKKEILGGAYDRNVAFKIPPFTVDSLNSEQEQAIAFEGIFLSKGIFPDFKEKLTLQHDLSLGFEHQIPKDGYPVYGNKGRFYDKISLNMLGIRGSGKLETMGSTILSEDLIFYPDSLVAIGSSAEVKKQSTPEVHHPDINIEEHEVKWFPKKDTLFFQTFSKPFNLYTNTSQFDGRIGLTSKAAFANGKMVTHGSEIISKKYNLKEESFTSQSSYFKIKSDNPDKPTMVSSNVKIDFDIKNNKTLITPEVEGFASDTFPYIQYSTSISRCEWDLEKQTLTMGNQKSKSVLGNFYSINKETDSLQFQAGYAFYDIKKQYLIVKGVPYIRVVDSEILPDSNKLTIFEGGRIKTLENAIVRMGSTNKYQVLTDAKVDIISRKEFKGEALLDYKSSDKEKHKIKVNEFSFTEIKEEAVKSKKKSKVITTRRIILAKAEIEETKNLHISEGILFKGTIELHSNQKNPIFNGFVKLDLKKNNSMGSWIAYKRGGDSSEVVINLLNATSDNGVPISNGLFLTVDGLKLYSSFISTKENDNDKDLLKVSGNLKYDPATKEYVVAEAKKLQNNFVEGNSFTFNDNTSAIHYQGKAFFIQPLVDFDIATSIIGSGNLDSAKYDFNTFLNFPANKVNPAAMASMTTAIVDYAAQKSAPYANDYTDQLRLKLLNIIGQKAFDSYEKEVGKGNQKSLSNLSKLAGSISISNLNLHWSEKYSAFYNKGLVGISNILKKEVNASIEAFVEIKRTVNGDAIKILFMPNGDKWYFLTYDNYRLALCSNDEEFTKAVQAKAKLEGSGKLSVVAADPSEKVQFNKDYNSNYFGKEIYDEYKPAEGTAPIESAPVEEQAPEEEKAPVEDKKKKKKTEAQDIPAQTLPAEVVPTEATPEEVAPNTPESEENSKKKKKKGNKEENMEEKQGF
ncbi:MAG: hypothetical protein H7329_09715 [Opitutaceae bacterium]|nr:hypothetical protein [Cytophagales bacterium]